MRRSLVVAIAAIVITVGLPVARPDLAAPVQAADITLTGSVTISGGGSVGSGSISFYSGGSKVGGDWGINNGSYTAIVPAGTYKLMVQPGPAVPALGGCYDSATRSIKASLNDCAAFTFAASDTLPIVLPPGPRVRLNLSLVAPATVQWIDVSGPNGGASAGFTDGSWWTSGLRAGNYRISVHLSGLQYTFYYAAGSSGNYSLVADSASVVAVSSADVTVSMTIPSLGGVSGFILDPGANAGIANARVNLCIASSSWACSDVQSGGDGSFRIAAPPGSYWLEITAPAGSVNVSGFYAGGSGTRFTPFRTSRATIAVAAGAENSLGQIVLPRGPRLTGQVLLAGSATSGFPVIALHTGFTAAQASGLSAADGRYTTSALSLGQSYYVVLGYDMLDGSIPPYRQGWYSASATGRYSPLFSDATPVSAANLVDITLNADVPRAYRVTVSAVREGGGAAYSLLEAPPVSGCTSGRWLGGAITPGGGYYDVPSGSYLLRVEGGYYASGRPGNFTTEKSSATTISVTSSSFTVPGTVTAPAGSRFDFASTGSCVTTVATSTAAIAAGSDPLAGTAATLARPSGAMRLAAVGPGDVTPTDMAGDGLPEVTVTFPEVTASGSSTKSLVRTAMDGTPIIDVATTASWTGDPIVCVATSVAGESQPTVHHWNGTAWEALETTYDPASLTACATSPSLSPFAVAPAGTTLPSLTPGEPPSGGPGGSGPTAVTQSQSISLSAPQRVRKGAALTLAATATSGLPVAYEVTTPAVCRLSGRRLWFRGEGTCRIVATQLGNGTWSPAPPAYVRIDVLPSSGLAARLGVGQGRVSRLSAEVAPGTRVVVRVRAADALASGRIELWSRREGRAAWRRVAVRTISTGGLASYSFTVTRGADYRWRIAPRSGSSARSSNIVSVRLR